MWYRKDSTELVMWYLPVFGRLKIMYLLFIFLTIFIFDILLIFKK
jgi:hypothetical protein